MAQGGKPGQALTPEQLILSAQHTIRELPIRLARRVGGFRALPFIVGSNPFISKTARLYASSFETLVKFGEIKTQEDNLRFTAVLEDLFLRMHKRTYIGEGVSGIEKVHGCPSDLSFPRCCHSLSYCHSYDRGTAPCAFGHVQRLPFQRSQNEQQHSPRRTRNKTKKKTIFPTCSILIYHPKAHRRITNTAAPPPLALSKPNSAPLV